MAMGDRPEPPIDDEVILQDEPEDEVPGAAMPSPWLFRGSLLTVVVGTALAIFLIASPPESEGQDEPTRTLATATAPPTSPTATATPPGATPSVTLPAPSPTPTLSPTPDGSARTHMVAAGETLSEIAGQYDTTVDAIIALNGGVDPNSITAGQVLQIPPAQ